MGFPGPDPNIHLAMCTRPLLEHSCSMFIGNLPNLDVRWTEDSEEPRRKNSHHVHGAATVSKMKLFNEVLL